MKRKITLFALLLSALACGAQTSWNALACGAQTSWVGERLPWMLERRTNGVRSMSKYLPSDSVMGARRLVETVAYDRHGYESGPMIELCYDSLGRLVRRVERVSREVAGTELVDTVRLLSISYTPEGLVNRYSDTSLSRIGNSWYHSMTDTFVTTYQLTSMSMQTGLGVTSCTYHYRDTWLPASSRGFDQEGKADLHNEEGTSTFERVFDEQGRLVREAVDDRDQGPSSYEFELVYDSHGRIMARYSTAWEYTDTLVYRYNALGQLIGMDGVAYSEDMKADVHIRCQADGRPLENATTWWNLDEDGNPYDVPEACMRTYYNERGDVVRTIYPGEPVYEYEYEYW